MLAENQRKFSHEFKREALVMASTLSAHVTDELMQIPEFKNEEALAILRGQELGTIEAKRHDSKKILRFVRKQDAVDILVEGKKDKNQTERQKTLTLPADCNRTPSRLPVFEYSESKTQNAYDLPRERSVLLRDGKPAFVKGKEFIKDLRKFR